MTQGFVVSDRVRHAVFAAVVHGEKDLDTIARRHRLIGKAAERAASELAEQGLIRKGAGGWIPTDLGEETARAMKRSDLAF